MKKIKKFFIFSLLCFFLCILIIFHVASLKSNKWDGKKLVTFGDPITWYDGNIFVGSHTEAGESVKGYQYYIRNKLKCTVINEGMDGKTMPDIWMDKIKSYDFSNVDAVTIILGLMIIKT